MAPEIHVNDIGTIFRVTLRDESGLVDLSTASTKQIIFRKPSGTILTKTASLTTDGTDGKLQYASVSGDLDAEGEWQLQARIAIGSGDWKSDIHRFTVHPNLS
jgi:hypothetical protein